MRTYEVCILKNTLYSQLILTFYVFYLSETVAKAIRGNAHTVCQLLPETGSIIEVSNVYAMSCRMIKLAPIYTP